MPNNHFNTWITGLTVAALSGCSTMPNTTQVQYEGAKVSVAQRVGGPPIVVFQSGLGDGMSAWSGVLQRLPPGMATFAYDRPGYGGSSRGPGKRDPCAIARELHEILRISGSRPPYVLVGHSLGGIYQYAFAKLYPSEVSAILLLDATHPEHWENMPQLLAPVPLLPCLGFDVACFPNVQDVSRQAARLHSPRLDRASQRHIGISLPTSDPRERRVGGGPRFVEFHAVRVQWCMGHACRIC